MNTQKALSRLEQAISAYLAHYRTLGRGYEQEEWVLGVLCAFFAREHRPDLDQGGFEAWRRTFCSLHPNSRYTYERIVYNFCRYRRRSESDCFLPDLSSLTQRIPRALPTPIEPAQIAAMMALASKLTPTTASPLRPAVTRMALVLLHTTGLRLGEVLRLRLNDVDAETGVLRIRESKFHRSRWVPLSPSAQAELREYLGARHHLHADARVNAPLLCNRSGGWRPYSPSGLQQAIQALYTAAGIRTRDGRCPRVHDIRHGFAVEALRRWYADGADVQVNLPKLSLFMGHVSIASTAYYLRWMPAVLAQASERFARHCSDLLAGERP